MTGNWASEGQLANSGSPRKWLLQQCMCVCVMLS